MEEVSFVDLMDAIRCGYIQVFLINDQLGWASKRRDDALVAALSRHAEAIKKMVASSDTRVCMRVSTHYPNYRNVAPWYSCPDCARTREHWTTIAVERQQAAHRVAS